LGKEWDWLHAELNIGMLRENEDDANLMWKRAEMSACDDSCAGTLRGSRRWGAEASLKGTLRELGVADGACLDGCAMQATETLSAERARRWQAKRRNDAEDHVSVTNPLDCGGWPGAASGCGVDGAGCGSGLGMAGDRIRRVTDPSARCDGNQRGLVCPSSRAPRG
jgi:hypothetical protein